jgi:hypothetical protein
MFPHKTLAGRLLYAILPWYLLLTLALTGVQLAIQYVYISRNIRNDLASLGRTVGPSMRARHGSWTSPCSIPWSRASARIPTSPG